MIVKDSMVVMHLAKITLLERSCEYFKKVYIPEAVYREVMEGSKKGYPDVKIFENLERSEKIHVKKVTNTELIRHAEEFNIQGGEAEAVALYWQEDAKYLASDDDNVRKKSVMLGIKIIGTPSIILKLYKEKIIGREKFTASLSELRKIGWFSSSIIDKMFMEAD